MLSWKEACEDSVEDNRELTEGHCGKGASIEAQLVSFGTGG